MVTIERLTQGAIGLSAGILLMAIIGMAAAINFSLDDKKEVVDLLRDARSQQVFLQDKINSTNNTNDEATKEKLQILLDSKDKQNKYIETLEKHATDIDNRISTILKWIFGSISMSAFLLAIVNFHYKYQHSLKFFITGTKSPNKLRKRLVITNKKDRTETILGAYLKGKNGEVIELLDLSCEPRSIASFGHTTIFFENVDDLENTNLCRYYKLYVVLGNGQTLKCWPIMQWKTAKGEKLMTLDRQRRVT